MRVSQLKWSYLIVIQPSLQPSNLWTLRVRFLPIVFLLSSSSFFLEKKVSL